MLVTFIGIGYLIYSGKLSMKKVKKKIKEVFTPQKYRALVNAQHMQSLHECANSLQQSKSHTEKSGILEHMGDLWKNGTADAFDGNGNVIKGVVPDMKKSIGYYKRAFETDPSNEQALLKIAKIYHFGMHGHDPMQKKNPTHYDMAMEIYQKILQVFGQSMSTEERTELHSYIQDIHTKRQMLTLNSWKNMPMNSGRGDTNTGSKWVQSFDIQNTSATDFAANVPIKDVDNIAALLPKAKQASSRQRRTAQREARKHRVIKNDLQNVHDHAVVNGFQQLLRKLEGTVRRTIPDSEVVCDVRDFLKNKPKCEKRDNAIRSLDAVERSTTPLSLMKDATGKETKEIDALSLVWNRIDQIHDKRLQETLRENLYNELAECVEHDSTVCVTGRFEHILDTLNMVDGVIKPSHIIRDEMGTKASKIMNDLLKGYTNEDKKKIAAVTSNPVQQKYEETAKTILEKELRKDYLVPGLLTETDFNTQLENICDAIF